MEDHVQVQLSTEVHRHGETIYDGMQARVQDNDETSEPFPVTNGVKQGCVLAPSLFSLMFSAMLTDAFKDGDTEWTERCSTSGGFTQKPRS